MWKMWSDSPFAMAKEIERKFLVSNGWRDAVDGSGIEMKQAYLSTDPKATVRVRVAGGDAWLTVKGLTQGIARDEWEYPVPVADACGMIDRCGTASLSKTRYRAGRWEIDEFHGALEGLVVAEIELVSADETVDLPAWIGKEVSGDPRYYNSELAKAMAAPPSR